MKQRNTMSINIGGESVRIITEESPERIVSIADYINRMIGKFKSKKPQSVPSNMLFAYSSLNLCLELFAARDEIAALKKELSSSKKELSEFVSAFGADEPKKPAVKGEKNEKT